MAQPEKPNENAPRIWIVGSTPDSKLEVHSDNEIDIERARIQAQHFVNQGTYTRAWVLTQRYEVLPEEDTTSKEHSD